MDPTTPLAVTGAMRQEIDQFMEDHDPDPRHCRHVRKLSLLLFDQLAERHQMGAGERFLLESAALLHDIGWGVAPDGRRHHKLARDMIRSNRWGTLPPETVEIIALIARYHRKSLPNRSHADYAALPRHRQEIVRKLAAILRVADALDRTHESTITSVNVADHGTKMTLRFAATHACDDELAAAKSKKDLFESEYGTRLEFLPTW